MMPVSLSGSGGSAGPSTATDAAYNPINFQDGAFVVGTSALGTTLAGGVAGATNSFSFGSLTNYMPYVLGLGALWIVLRYRKSK